MRLPRVILNVQKTVARELTLGWIDQVVVDEEV
jgi:hypothetical protein